MYEKDLDYFRYHIIYVCEIFSEYYCKMFPPTLKLSFFFFKEPALIFTKPKIHLYYISIPTYILYLCLVSPFLYDKCFVHIYVYFFVNVAIPEFEQINSSVLPLSLCLCFHLLIQFHGNQMCRDFDILYRLYKLVVVDLMRA